MLWQVLRMYDGGLELSGIKSMYVDTSACVRVKGGESEWFRTDSGVSYSLGCSMYIGWRDEGGVVGE